MAPGPFVFSCLISSVLLTGVTSIKCFTCFTTDRDCRNEDMTLVECEPDEPHCISLTFRSTFSTPSVTYTTKNCAKPEDVFDGYYSMTSTQGKFFEFLHDSCQSPGCNAIPLALPYRQDLKTNGFVCPGSFTNHGNATQTPQQILCLGIENWCGTISFGMDILGGIREELVVQGCFTNNVCNSRIGELQAGNGILKINVTSRECTIASKFIENMHFTL